MKQMSSIPKKKEDNVIILMQNLTYVCLLFFEQNLKQPFHSGISLNH